jgi:hypothetical protein
MSMSTMRRHPRWLQDDEVGLSSTSPTTRARPSACRLIAAARGRIAGDDGHPAPSFATVGQAKQLADPRNGSRTAMALLEVPTFDHSAIVQAAATPPRDRAGSGCKPGGESMSSATGEGGVSLATVT